MPVTSDHTHSVELLDSSNPILQDLDVSLECR